MGQVRHWALLRRLGLNNENTKVWLHPGTNKRTAFKANTGPIFSHVKELPLTEYSVLVHSHKIITAKIQSFPSLPTTNQTPVTALSWPIFTDLEPDSEAKRSQCLHNWILVLDFALSFSLALWTVHHFRMKTSAKRHIKLHLTVLITQVAK